MALRDDLARIANVAARYADNGEEVSAIIAAESSPGERTYLCAFEGRNGRTWLAFDDGGSILTSREGIRETVSIAAMSEVANESAGGGELEELRSRLLTLRLIEQPPGLDEAEAAALELEAAIGSAPRVASPARLDAIGAAARRLERALGGGGDSSFAVAMQQAVPAVEELAREVETNYKVSLT